jgi:para-aminobenzoate synthetase / 4-amino-4-deoxychorismate lyase
MSPARNPTDRDRPVNVSAWVRHADSGRWLVMSGLVDVLQAVTPAQVPTVIAAAEAAAIRSGVYAVGFVTFEAAAGFEPKLVTHPPGRLPPAWFALFAEAEDAGDSAAPMPCQAPPLTDLDWQPSIDAVAYGAKVATIRNHIAAGDSYQVNLTFALQAAFSGSTEAFYRDLCRAQRSGYCAHLRFGSVEILSASPELFFRRTGDRVEMRPMKGTRPRGRWSEEDDLLAASLRTSAKDRAENLMIVDLLRNDLGRVAEFGSVEVTRLFEVERYPTVHQLTSTVRARPTPDVSASGVFRSLFPSGSVTGAPKVRTTKIIRELEDSPRGIYTGAIGFWSRDEAVFSVAIRTAWIDRSRGSVEVGVGSGITADSDPAAEYRECMDKGAFLSYRPAEFELLESLRLETGGGYARLEQHLARLAGSARYFGFTHDGERVRRELDQLAADLAEGTYKVRLRLDRSGRLLLDAEAIPSVSPPLRICLAAEPVDERSVSLYHKTTSREVYDRALAAAPGAGDVVLHNSRGELTETATGNLVLEIGGSRFTPPVEAGLLPGVMREWLLAEGRVAIRSLTVEDLQRADRIFVINSVRGCREAHLINHI